MDESKTAPPRTASRTVAIAAVALLIAIAIAGIVLGTVRHRGDSPDAADTASTQASAAPLTAAVDVAPNEVLFAASSDRLSASDLAKIALLGEKARNESKMVAITSKVEANHPSDLDLARRRAANVRVALLSGGVTQTMMRIEISQFPAGLLPPRAVDRIEVVMRDR